MKLVRRTTWTIFVAAMLIAGLLISLAVRDRHTADTSAPTSNATSSKDHEAAFKSTEPKNSSTVTNDKSASATPRVDARQQLLTAMATDFEKQSLYHSMCKSNLDELQASIDEEIVLLDANSNLTEPQVAAREALIEKCREWHDFIAASESGESPYKPSALEQQLLDEMLDSNNDSAARSLAAYELLGSNDANMIGFAAAYLLNTDEDLQTMIAKSTGSSTPIYTRNAAGEILTVFSCRLEGDCSADSMFMQSMCITDPQACGVNMFGYLSLTHSPAYLNDIYLMANSLYYGIRQLNRLEP